MNILFIAPNYLPHIGGVEKHLMNVSTEILKDGHSITIVVMKVDPGYQDYEKNGALEIVRLLKSETRFVNRINIIKYMFLNFKKLMKFDVIHFHDYGTFWSFGLPVWLPLKLIGKKMFVTFHGWEGVFPPLKRVIVKRKITEKLTDGNMCIGHFIEKWYGTHADVISYGGVHLVSDLSQNREMYWLYIGRIANDTGIWDYIKAWEVFVKEYPNEQLVICGDGILRKEIEKYIATHKIDNVQFQGFVADVERYIQDAKAVFTTGYLGILEAFSYKKSVLSTYDNALKKDYLEMMPNYQTMLWAVHGEDEVLEAMDEIMHNNKKKERGYQYACKNSWRKVAEEYYRLWKM